MSALNQAVAAAAVGIILRQRRNRMNKRERWVSEYLARRSVCVSVEEEVRMASNVLFKNFTCMSPSDFEILSQLVGPLIAKENTKYREAIPVATRLVLTLRFLATSDNYPSLMFQFKVSKASLGTIIREICQVLVKSVECYMLLPRTPDKWLNVAQDFEVRWNFPHCLGALDGKHVLLQYPFNSGSSYFNYKETFSIVLFTLVDANYIFQYVNIGKPGRMSDGGVFLQTSLYIALGNGELNASAQQSLPGSNAPTPYVFVADDTFPLTSYLMKPYPSELERGSPKRLYNYRLSRACHIVENGFGMLAAVWRIFGKPIMVKTDTVEYIVLMC